jgi:LPS sulfotransferase NodH
LPNPLLKHCQDEQDENEWQAVFTSPLGHLRDSSNVQANLRDVFDRIGYKDITSHTFRRTVATSDGRGWSVFLARVGLKCVRIHYDVLIIVKVVVVLLVQHLARAKQTMQAGNAVSVNVAHWIGRQTSRALDG